MKLFLNAVTGAAILCAASSFLFVEARVGQVRWSSWYVFQFSWHHVEWCLHITTLCSHPSMVSLPTHSSLLFYFYVNFLIYTGPWSTVRFSALFPPPSLFPWCDATSNSLRMRSSSIRNLILNSFLRLIVNSMETRWNLMLRLGFILMVIWCASSRWRFQMEEVDHGDSFGYLISTLPTCEECMRITRCLGDGCDGDGHTGDWPCNKDPVVASGCTPAPQLTLTVESSWKWGDTWWIHKLML